MIAAPTHIPKVVVIITPRACATGKAIGRVVVVVNTKIVRSRLLGVLASVQYYYNVENGKKK